MNRPIALPEFGSPSVSGRKHVTLGRNAKLVMQCKCPDQLLSALSVSRPSVAQSPKAGLLM